MLTRIGVLGPDDLVDNAELMEKLKVQANQQQLMTTIDTSTVRQHAIRKAIRDERNILVLIDASKSEEEIKKDIDRFLTEIDRYGYPGLGEKKAKSLSIVGLPSNPDATIVPQSRIQELAADVLAAHEPVNPASGRTVYSANDDETDNAPKIVGLNTSLQMRALTAVAAAQSEQASKMGWDTARRALIEPTLEHVTTSSVLSRLADLQVPDFGPTENQIIKRNKELWGRAETGVPFTEFLKQQYAQSTELSQIPIEKFNQYLDSLIFTEHIGKWKQQVEVERAKYPRGEGPLLGDNTLAIRAELIGATKGHEALLDKALENSRKLNDLLAITETNVIRQPVIDFNKAIKFIQTPIEERKTASISETDKTIADDLIARDSASIKLKQDLLTDLREIQRTYKERRGDNATHMKDLAALIQKAEKAPDYESALRVVEKAFLAEKTRYEKGRVFAKVAMWEKLPFLDFQKKLSSDPRSFMYPQLLAKQVLKKQYERFPPQSGERMKLKTYINDIQPKTAALNEKEKKTIKPKRPGI